MPGRLEAGLLQATYTRLDFHLCSASSLLVSPFGSAFEHRCHLSAVMIEDLLIYAVCWSYSVCLPTEPIEMCILALFYAGISKHFAIAAA